MDSNSIEVTIDNSIQTISDNEDNGTSSDEDNCQQTKRSVFSLRKRKMFTKSSVTMDMFEEEEGEVEENSGDEKDELTPEALHLFNLYHSNYDRDMDQYRDYFQKLLDKLNRVKIVVVAFAVFHIAFTISSQFWPLQNFQSQSAYSWSPTGLCLSHRNQLISFVSFVFTCLGLAVGILLGCHYQPERHLFTFNHRNSCFISAVVFVFVFGIDCVVVIFHQLQQLHFFPVAILLKSILIGFLLIYLLYVLFDIKIDPINRYEAQKCVRIYVLMLTLGIGCALLVNLYYFSNTSQTDSRYLNSIVFSIFLCRLFLSLNCAILLYLLWHGVACIHQLNFIKNIDFEDFLSHYNVESNCSHLVTLNLVCFSCQIEYGQNVNHLNEDNFSIRTVKEWRKACFSITGIALFSLASSSELSHLFCSIIWFPYFYPSLTANQIFLGQIFLFGSLAMTRVYNLTASWQQSTLTTGKNKSWWSRNIYKFTCVYLLNILANLFQLYLVKHSYYLVLFTNILFGISLGLMLEHVSKFISSYMTITSLMIRYTLVLSIFYISIVAFVIYFLMSHITHVMPIFYINIASALAALIIIGSVSRSKCLVSQNSFDLIEMHTPTSAMSFDFGAHHKDQKSQSVPEISRQVQFSEQTNTPIASSSHQPHPSSLEHSPPFQHQSQQPSTSSGRIQSHSHLYRYASADKIRKTSVASVIAYRIKFRLESIVSILIKEG